MNLVEVYIMLFSCRVGCNMNLSYFIDVELEVIWICPIFWLLYNRVRQITFLPCWGESHFCFSFFSTFYGWNRWVHVDLSTEELQLHYLRSYCWPITNRKIKELDVETLFCICENHSCSSCSCCFQLLLLYPCVCS